MIYKELTLDERNHDIWKPIDGQYYAIILMYSVNNTSEPRFVASDKLRYNTAMDKLEGLLNDWEQERAVCLNSHFINPKNIICIKLDKWKDKNGRINYDGEFYE